MHNENWIGGDSYKKETTRGGHELPGVLTDKQISKLYLEVMMRFFNSIHNLDNVQYYCVGESNHWLYFTFLTLIIFINQFYLLSLCYKFN